MSRDPRRDDLEALLDAIREERNNWTPEQRDFTWTPPPLEPRVTLQPNPRPSRKSFLVFGLAMALVATGLIGLVVKLIGGG